MTLAAGRRERGQGSRRFAGERIFFEMQDSTEGNVPPPVIQADPERELEQKLRRNPEDDDAKVDVGSDESMDASDPLSSSQPGCSDEPVPSSGFPSQS
jgi:hypothetical protein